MKRILSIYAFFSLFLSASPELIAQSERSYNPILSTPPTGGNGVDSQSGYTSGRKIPHLKIDSAINPVHIYDSLAVSTDRSFILSVIPLDATDSIRYADGELLIGHDIRALTEIRYFDGLNRLSEIVQRGITPDNEDLVSLQEYDSFGRESTAWLPTAVPGNGRYVDPASLKNQITSQYADTRPYTRPEYEMSPLNRVLRQYGAGNNWRNHPSSINYEVNSATDPELTCRRYSTIGTGQVRKQGNYPEGMLSVFKSSDEDGRTLLTFKNQQGLLLLTRQKNNDEYHDTYYVYNDLGNLCFVLSPAASDLFSADGTLNSRSDAIARYGYYYRYDSRGLCVEKQLPGRAPIYQVYDRSDRLIYSQTGEQRNKAEWSFRKYDVLGRPILEGTVLLTGETASALQARTQDELIVESPNDSQRWKYTEKMTPFTANPYVTVLKAYYYDRYSALPIPASEQQELGYNAENSYGNQHVEGGDCSTRGKLTATLVNVLHTDRMLATRFYYDDKGRIIQQKSTNHSYGIEKFYTRFDYSGQPVSVKQKHSSGVKPISPGQPPRETVSITEYYTYNYDHSGRVLQAKHQIDGQETMILFTNTYDRLGRIQTRRQGNLTDTIRYAYNIRGRISSIRGKAFSQTLYYNESGIPGAVPQYNGNISAMSWQRENGTDQAYKYKYDGLNRLTAGLYGKANGPIQPKGYSETLRFDKNGNITALQRDGLKKIKGVTITGDSIEIKSFTTIDNLTYTYTGNQVKNIADAAGSQLYIGANDFRNGVVADQEYTYDKNGNQTSDLNKKINRIVYNLLNLPDTVFFDNKNIQMSYDANGMKLSQSIPAEIVQDPIPVTPGMKQPTPTISFPPLEHRWTTTYVGSHIYTNGNLSRILIPEGYILVGNGQYRYYFYQVDYLKNIRAVTSAQGEVVERNDYYPYGMLFGSSVGEVNQQPYKLGGKEYISAKGYNMYDFGARGVDGANPRWTTFDAMAEMCYPVSPYAYCNNNPVKYIDRDGNMYEDSYSDMDFESDDWYKNKEGKMQFDPLIKKDSKLQPGEKYMGESYQEKNKNGAVTADYRSDGSILFTSEARAYDRMVDRTQKTGNESFAALTSKGSLVLPDNKNTSTGVDLSNYKYKFKNGNIVDPFGKTFTTYGTVHTHPEGGGVSGEDRLFGARTTPYKPVYVFQMGGVNKVSFIVAQPDLRSIGETITDIFPNADLDKIKDGSFPLTQFTTNTNFRTHLRATFK